MSTRKELAIKILDSITSDVGKPDVSTMELLYRSQEVARLLELEEEESLWISLELEGYPSQDLTTFREENEALEKIKVPYYRIITLPATATAATESVVPFQIGYQKMPMTAPFYITSPCGELETAKNPMTISFDMLFDKPKGRWDLSSDNQQKIPARFVTKLEIGKMKGIVYAIRGRVNRFATSHRTALNFEDSLSRMVDSTRNLIADRFQRIHQPLLDLVDETIRKQESSSDPLQWRNVLENTRSILRRFTGVVLKESMIPEGSSMPAEEETRNKTRMILDWARNQIGENDDRELEQMAASFDVIQAKQSALIGLINKFQHGEVDDVSKGEVDRLLQNSILWIADILHILDKSGYDWDNN